MNDFKKIINPIKVELRPNRFYNVFIKIEYKDGKLSLSGVEGPLPSGNCIGGCGQIDMHLRDLPRNQYKFNNGWNETKWRKLLYIWDKYHLNDMHSGTPRQEEVIMRKFGNQKADDYTQHVEYLKSINLYEDNGYRYGSGWLTQKVPENVLDFLRRLENTKNTPAWV